LAALLLYHRKKTLQKVTVTVMVNDCTTSSISDMLAVFKYYMVKNKSETLWQVPVWSTIRTALQTAIWACG